MSEGIRRLVWFPKELDDMVNSVCKELGLKRSHFVRNCIFAWLESYGLITAQLEGLKSKLKEG